MYHNNHKPMNQLLLLSLLLVSNVTAAQSTNPPLEQLVPVDKKLDPAWVASLTAHGEPQVSHSSDLGWIGMPVGGLFAGQLYLGGDGKLWNWDIFNGKVFTGAEHYAHPMKPSEFLPLQQGFSLKIGDRTIPLDTNGFADVTFRGEYPIGTVRYKDPSVPLSVTLEAFSPFIPLDVEDSSLPATVMRFTLANTSSATVEATLSGALENAVLLRHRDSPGRRVITTVREKEFTMLEYSVKQADLPVQTQPRGDILIEDWNKETYEGWNIEGTAFGSGPTLKTQISNYMGNVGGDTERVANSHAPTHSDGATGKLTGKPFLIDRDYLILWVGGGNNPGQTGVNLLVDGKVVSSATGHNKNEMQKVTLDLRKFHGKQGVLEIVDNSTNPWGNIGVGRIVLSDKSNQPPFEQLPDNGTMGLALLGEKADSCSGDQTSDLSEKLVGTLGRTVKLAPGESVAVNFLVTWYFPNLSHLPNLKEQGRWYASKFDSALGVARYVADNEKRLTEDTFLWRKTWYDSTLPYWFLDRTFLNTSILATSTSYRLKNGRYWAWEGVGDCAGTCGHVYYYGQAVGRLFPEIEREQREYVDFAIAQQPDGSIRFRGENNKIPAIDGQAGYILRALREHQASKDDAFLRRIWPRVKLANDWLIKKDGSGSGIIHGAQHNTLDKDWYGEVAWLSGLYQAALLASAEMAAVMNDPGYAAKCQKIADAGKSYMSKNLFIGEYYINKVDPNKMQEVNSGTGCHIDQVMGQSWAFQVGLPRVFPKDETVKSLQSLWKYNFAPDVGPFREVNQQGRWYARPGEAGLIMCTFPRPDWNYDKAAGKAEGFQKMAAGYFNECMNGFEHQVAGHMIWEGTPGSDLVTKGLAIERALHDRYGASKRNPYNEIECGDHYGRSMASYGVFLAACGFEYDGPAGHIGFAPRLHPENFKAAFTAAEGWGSFSQRIDENTMTAELEVKWGQVALHSFSLATSKKPDSVTVICEGKEIEASVETINGKTTLTFKDQVMVKAEQTLKITLKFTK
jgi:uncharacterized protein (DUF608 family)